MKYPTTDIDIPPYTYKEVITTTTDNTGGWGYINNSNNTSIKFPDYEEDIYPDDSPFLAGSIKIQGVEINHIYLRIERNKKYKRIGATIERDWNNVKEAENKIIEVNNWSLAWSYCSHQELCTIVKSWTEEEGTEKFLALII